MTNREALIYCLQNACEDDETCSVDIYDKVGTPHWVKYTKGRIKVNCDSEFDPFCKDGEPYFTESDWENVFEIRESKEMGND